ncbi:MAG: PstS family phosphate ABC transporter substrate-binding protein [Spirochaetota bacterium]
MKKLMTMTAALVLAGNMFAQSIQIDGSSTVYPITEAVAEEFGKINPKIKVLVGISGTGGGFKRFGNGETHISDASRPIKNSEKAACRKSGIDYIELPVAYDGLAVMVSKKNDFVKSLTVKELKKLWEPAAKGNVTKWNQVRESFPAEKIRLFGPGTDSGTFDYFTEAIMGKSGQSRSDYTASEDDNVLVEGIAGNKGGLGYFGLAYYEANKDKLSLVAIDGGKGAIEPTIETVKNGTYAPLSRPLFIYVSTAALGRPEVVQFVEFYIKNAAKLSKEVGYIPLPDDGYAAVMKRFQKRVTGSAFSDTAKTIGVTIADLLKME